MTVIQGALVPHVPNPSANEAAPTQSGLQSHIQVPVALGVASNPRKRIGKHPYRSKKTIIRVTSRQDATGQVFCCNQMGLFASHKVSGEIHVTRRV